MESKKKKKVILTISLISIFLICAVIGTFLIMKNINKDKGNSNSPATNVSSTDKRLLNATIDIIEQKVSQNYNGNYKFKTVGAITFNENLKAEQIEYICEQKFKTTDINGILYSLNKDKKSEANTNEEKIVLKNGRYTKSHNGTKVVEKGRYFGNDDLSEISLLTNNGYEPTYEMSLTCIKGELISSTITDDSNPDRTKLYLYRKVYSSSDDKLLLFTITYVYEMLEDTTNIIPDSKLDFEI